MTHMFPIFWRLPTLATSSFILETVQAAILGSWFRIRRMAFSLQVQLGIERNVSDEILMEAYLNGDENALRVLFHRYAPRLMSVGLKRGLSREEAKDAVQQTFVHFHQSRQDFKLGTKLRPWLFTIALNAMRDLGRRYQSQHRLKNAVKQAEQARDGAIGDNNGQKELHNSVNTALAQLSTEQREVILLHYYDGMSFSEIARALGCREGTIRGRAHRGYEKLRVLLKNRNSREGER